MEHKIFVEDRANLNTFLANMLQVTRFVNFHQ